MERWHLTVTGFADTENDPKAFAAAARDWADSTGLLDPTTPDGTPPDFVSYGGMAVIACDAPMPLAHALAELSHRHAFTCAMLARIPDPDPGPDRDREWAAVREVAERLGHRPPGVAAEEYTRVLRQDNWTDSDAARPPAPQANAYACRMPEEAG